MAEVLSPILPASSTITVLHSRSSSTDAYQDSVSHQAPRLGQQSRNMPTHAQSSTSYRGTTTPVQPYAFQSTPHLRSESRSISTTSQAGAGAPSGSSHGTSASISSSASSAPSLTKDDSLKASNLITLSSSVPDLTLVNPDSQTIKISPERYRRPQQRRTDSSSTAQPNTVTVEQARTTQRQPSVDDMAVRAPAESAKRYRRRSLGNLDTTNLLGQDDAHIVSSYQRPSSSGPGMNGATTTPTSINPTVFHRRTSSKDAVAQTNNQRAQQNGAFSETVKPVDTVVGRSDAKPAGVPSRLSSEATKRVATPSPLSQQMADTPSPARSPEKPRSYAAVASAGLKSPSPAAQQLAAVSDRDLNKGMKSRLRRAFSFGSSQELRRASAQNNMSTNGNQDDEMDAEQLEIARRQEAAGIGAGIYSGQGGFTGSTDNISISSTASSASLMLRKMGQSARKSARSIKGLFRPKSVIGVPAADGPVQPYPNDPSQPSAQVSMVNVEAERQKVNVNLDPHDRPGGGTGYPKLERNSLDAPNTTRASADGDSATSRRSVVGSDKDRAEILAAVKKGILKRSGTNSPILRPEGDTPGSSMPDTPQDRAGVMSNSDYFSAHMTAIRVSKSMPNTPNGTVRNISFSPRIQFHDAWSSTEYDRRGEIATCNRLTPMLAQQIKEELNNFKMEMEVHELSKPHTHFF